MESDLTPSFTTYKNYLRAFAGLAGFFPAQVDDAEALAGLAERIRPSLPARQGKGVTGDLEGVRKSLVAAWGTELILALGGVYATEDEFVRLTNNWAAVQLYYVLYHATQAALQAQGQPRPSTHTKTQNMFSDLWITSCRNVAPWSFGLGDGGYHNLPVLQAFDQDAKPISRPRSIESCWSLAATALRTTRDLAVEEAFLKRRKELQSAVRRAWRTTETTRLAKGRPARPEPRYPLPRLSPDEKTRLRAGVRCHNFMDFCYRLRVKTNYDDSRMFLEGPVDTHSSAEVHQDMRRLASSTLLLHELLVRQYVGDTAMRTLVDEWLKGNTAAGVLGLRQRRDLILS